jgi:hypothetical protein
MFMSNFIGILGAWITSIIFYLFCLALVYLLNRFNNLFGVEQYKGWKLKFFILKFKLFSFIKATLEQLTECFIYTGMLRVFISTAYDFNFAIFLDIHNTKVDDKESFL